jgi:predicted transcriptional regulator of viral defense system
MKSKKNLLEQLKPLPYFGKNTLYQLGKQLGLKDASINTYISRFLKNRDIALLMRGVYVTSDFFEKNRTDISYSFYLANILRRPSYVSSWAALQYYDLATEAIHSITSVTLKVTREYRTRAGNFPYQSIDKRLFSDFVLEKGKFDFFIATPSKALFDLLYFRTRGFRGIAIDRVRPMIEELRIEFDDMSEEEQKKFNSILKKYYERTA